MAKQTSEFLAFGGSSLRSSLFVAACEEKQLVFTFNGTLAFIFRPRPCLFSDSRSIKGHAAAGSQRRRRRLTVAPNGKNPPENRFTCCNFTIFVSRQISSRFSFPVIACAVFKIRQTVGNIKYDQSISRIFHKNFQQIYIISVSGHCMRLLSI